ncbi:patatin-like phospholipase family protein [Amycolatopsis sp. WQ 127309]|uniref:patatin-like phospholipase family protein n=1 Tax=Amycolatopsis sp. WQ 127309 TaxID=2932773 RepID=UPI001FF2ED1F|nr:patatin-like phospholipase family protein [Amycolatopsis sp. WQ 127309]UOZ09256.1 patatin-like phospholipase family protein [Amycolatopsis sp. WQ 127309]
MSGQALVLGGGGVAGIAWTTGLLAGLAGHGQDLTGADLIVGTSAGATVAAQVTSGVALEDLLARQADPARQTPEIPAEIDMEKFVADFGAAFEDTGSPAEVRQRVGELALSAETVSEADRRAVIAARLPSHDWPEQRIVLVAVDAETGEPRQFDRESGVSLVDAVAASCAVPGIWPPTTIDGRRYIDGGVRSGENADYAAGATRVTVVAPLGLESPLPGEKALLTVLEDLRKAGAEIAVISPDEASVAAIGQNPLDPSTRTPAAEAGHAQGATLTLTWS